ncbi:serine hydrolase [Kitasatospora phosalacinea]|uniref:serine hydrolase n=1 Tax=Kitasatospora phosalacinea TaxID=2065 RepID=UPI00068E8276|nr:serine hydrolase [Kitasatospora phosalacinea]
MATRRRTDPPRPTRLAGALVAALALGLAPVQAASAAPVGHPAYCSSATHPELADRLSRDLADAIRGRRSTLALAVRDPGTGLSCSLDPSRHFDSASIVKVTIMGAVLRIAQDEDRPLTPFEEENLRPMITRSDNDAAVRLWKYVGPARMRAFLDLADMRDTVLSADGFGLTQVTAGDEMKQLDAFTGDLDVLTPEHREYGLRLMAEVEADQRWGTPFGAPPDVTTHVKNGWLQRATHGWRVHSLGIFTGPTRVYRIAVLTDDDPTESYGIGTIQRISRRVHQDLADSADGGRARIFPGAPDVTAPESGDGSASEAGER